jgi:7,8-dihydroneopterin aldolase/epimerase/oxygenase
VTDPQASDRIEIRGLRVLGVHGALPEEQVRAQPFEIDLDVESDLAPAGGTDSLDATIDYAAVIDIVQRIVQGERYALLERLATRICDAVLAADGRAHAVSVTIRKLRPPVAAELASAGVHLRRARGS